MTNQLSQTPLCYTYSCLKIEAKSGILNCLYCGYFQQTFFPISYSHFSFCKMPRNNFNSDQSTVFIVQIYFYLPKLYFSLLIGTQIDGINKQQLVLVNWLNKAIWKSALNIATKDLLLCNI